MGTLCRLFCSFVCLTCLLIHVIYVSWRCHVYSDFSNLADSPIFVNEREEESSIPRSLSVNITVIMPLTVDREGSVP